MLACSPSTVLLSPEKRPLLPPPEFSTPFQQAQVRSREDLRLSLFIYMCVHIDKNGGGPKEETGGVGESLPGIHFF
jgi:hypothetical protein